MLSMLVDHKTSPMSAGAANSRQASFPRYSPVPALPVLRPKRHRFTQKQRHYVASLQDYNCYLCGDQFCHDLKDMDIDHILALERGGKDWPDLTNLSALCVACHRRKTILERERAK
jgi:5-methylcytosine-specific restriction endonuclease McrA